MKKFFAIFLMLVIIAMLVWAGYQFYQFQYGSLLSKRRAREQFDSYLMKNDILNADLVEVKFDPKTKQFYGVCRSHKNADIQFYLYGSVESDYCYRKWGNDVTDALSVPGNADMEIQAIISPVGLNVDRKYLNASIDIPEYVDI